MKSIDYMLEVSIFQKCRVVLYEKAMRPEISDGDAERDEMESGELKCIDLEQMLIDNATRRGKMD